MLAPAGPAGTLDRASGTIHGLLVLPVFAGLLGRPGLDAETPQAHEPLGVLVLEPVGGLVGRQVVVVEGDVAAPAGDDAAAGKLAAQAHLAGDEALALV